jgi:hypothetical protein
MRTTKHFTLALLGVVAALGIAALLFIMPNYREARAVRLQVRELQARLSSLGNRTQAVERLARDVESAREHVANDLKIIPESADVADLIRKLSYPIDGVTVTDQTFTAGSPADAIVGGVGARDEGKNAEAQAPPQALPVSAELSATFESVLALVQKAEAMDRLIRVASVRMLCKRDEQMGDVPLLKASVGLEVIYDAPAAQKETR